MIIRQELLKLVKMPIIPILIGFFMILNVVIIMNHSYLKESLPVLTNLVDQHGYEINEDMMSKFQTDYKEIVEQVNLMHPDDQKDYQHPSELLLDVSSQYDAILSSSKLERLQKYSVTEGYYRTAKDIDHVYENINLASSAEELIHLYGFEENAATSVRSQFQKLETRLDQLVANDEHKNLFFMENMHSFLFSDIGLVLIFELMILVVLITAAVANYEFEHRTALITYTTKRGKKLIIDKLLTAVTANIFVMIFIIGATLGAFFLTYDYSGLWQVPISSYFNAETKLPYISWWNLSFMEYLVVFVLLIVLSQLIFMGFSYILSVFLKNTYLVFFSFIILLGIGNIVPNFAPMSSNLIFILQFNPFVLILNPHEWLMGNGPFTIHSYYEAGTIIIWLFLLSVLGGYSIYRFKRQQLY
ncbi:hypothetical protein [Paraliobacillus sp. JSM ZJ581]|uniref:hypothetical protein n=1 Tax=Paraliobacillus sp. JSM ZJ581 TaxID=3342118 RepID=UPI0035A96773